jgi:ABC-type sugar transport system ATPase subunit
MARLLLENVTKIYDRDIYAAKEVSFSSDLKMVVDVIEPKSNELYVQGRCGDIILSARVSEDASPRVSKSFILKIKPEKIYIFDEQTEETIA